MTTVDEILEAIEQLSPDDKQTLIDRLGEVVPRQTRVAGLHEHLGHAWMSEDFDEPLPDAFWLGEEE